MKVTINKNGFIKDWDNSLLQEALIINHEH
jgi:hypothetical protein